MKQNITKNQWNELSKEQRQLWFNFIGDDFATFPETIYECNDCGVSCLPSIGQMIEFLIEKGNFHDEPGAYVDNGFDRTINYEDIEIGWNGIELCDTLWEKVKEVLK